jgi:hypothetical protein
VLDKETNPLKTIVFVAVSMALACGCLVAQPIQINQASIAASANGATRATGGFPFTISQPGSYQLSGNIVVPPNVQGIVIASSNVTLDLNGFTITCLGPINPALGFFISAITTPSLAAPPLIALSMITVRNGGVVGPDGPFTGVNLGNLATQTGMTVQDLTVTGGRNGDFSILTGPNSILRHNIVTGAILADCPSIITENISSNSSVSGESNPTCILWNNRGTNFTAPISQ